MGISIADLTPEQRVAFLEVAHKARRDKIAAWQLDAILLKQEFKDMPHWRRLGSQFKVRMPAMYIPITELKYARRAAKATNVDFVAHSGCTLKQFAELNPDWPVVGLVGLILEAAADDRHLEFEDLPVADDFDLDALI